MLIRNSGIFQRFFRIALRESRRLPAPCESGGGAFRKCSRGIGAGSREVIATSSGPREVVGGKPIGWPMGFSAKVRTPLVSWRNLIRHEQLRGARVADPITPWSSAYLQGSVFGQIFLR